jgi:hypothetical protein
MPSPMFSLSCSGGLAALPTLASIPMATLLLGPIFTVRVANELTSINPPSLDAAGAHFGQPDCDDPTCISRRAGTWRLRRACSHFCCIREGANDLRAAKRNGFGQLRAHSASGEAGMDQPLPPLGYHRMSYPSWVRHLRSRCPNTPSANVHRLSISWRIGMLNQLRTAPSLPGRMMMTCVGRRHKNRDCDPRLLHRGFSHGQGELIIYLSLARTCHLITSASNAHRSARATRLC